jgi:deazaflavin-dependent oxidoreductase (nitroreductase family)
VTPKSYVLGPGRRLVNLVVKALDGIGLAPPHTYILVVPGRTTGVPRQTPVRLIEAQHRRWLVAPYGEREWVKNARAAGQVELRRGRRRRERLRVVELPAGERAPILYRYARENRVTRPFFDARVADGVEAFMAEAARHPVFELLPLPAESIVPGTE